MAGYPYGVRVVSYNETIEVASGQPYQGKIVVEVIDPDHNLISTDD